MSEAAAIIPRMSWPSIKAVMLASGYRTANVTGSAQVFTMRRPSGVETTASGTSPGPAWNIFPGLRLLGRVRASTPTLERRNVSTNDAKAVGLASDRRWEIASESGVSDITRYRPPNVPAFSCEGQREAEGRPTARQLQWLFVRLRERRSIGKRGSRPLQRRIGRPRSGLSWRRIVAGFGSGAGRVCAWPRDLRGSEVNLSPIGQSERVH